MDWELTKENCVPVKQGRSKAALQELADPAAEALETKRRELWTEVAEYNGDDPLEPWQRYIKWMQEYGVGGGKADLLKVLEACTKELQKYPRYTNDIRFLRIWIQYADCLPDPGDVFLFLKEKGIGRSFALYYEAYATYFELKGNFQSADAVYTDGTQRGAKPLERLKQKHLAFQQRMAHRLQRQIQDEQVMGPPPPEPVRSSLGTIGQRPVGRSRQAAQQPYRLFGAEAPQQQPSCFGSRAGQQTAAKPSIAVLADEEFGGAENGLFGLPGYSSMPQLNNLRELKPFGVVRKENLDRPMAWNQAALHSAAGTSAAGGVGIEIFTDEEFKDEGDDQSAAPAGRAAVSASGGLGTSTSHPLLQSTAAPGPSAGPSGRMDALMNSLAPPPALLRGLQPAPMQLLVDRAVASKPHEAATTARSESQHNVALVSASGEGPGLQPAAGPTNGLCSGTAQIQSSAFAGTGLVGLQPGQQQAQPEANANAEPGPSGTGGEEEEMSLEELRAAAWVRRNPNYAQVASSTGDQATKSGGVLSESENASRITARDPPDPENPRGMAGGKRAFGPVVTAPSSAEDVGGENIRGATAWRACFGQVASGAATDGAAAHRPAQALPAAQDQTTRRALNGGPAGAVAPVRQPFAGVASGARAALSALRDPKGVGGAAAPPAATMPSAPCGRAVHTGGHLREEPPPTVTISTRDAFDLMNSLFTEDLPQQHGRVRTERAEQSEAGQPLRCSVGPAEPVRPHGLGVQAPVSVREVGTTSASAVQASAEPTVTLHTRLAFDALNDMFNETLPHEEARKLARRAGVEGGHTATLKPMTGSDVRRLANANRNPAPPPPSGAGSRMPPGKQQTGAVGGAGSNPAASQAAVAPLAIHEDTFFLGPAAAASTANRGTVGAIGVPQPSLQDSAIGGIYEDTEFIPRGPPPGNHGAIGSGHNNQSRGAFILEDTEFLTQH